MTLRRPIRSPRMPAITAPKRNPKGVADPMMPSSAALSPHSVFTDGRRNATMAASIPSKV